MHPSDRGTDFSDICPSCNKVRINTFCHHCGEQRLYDYDWSTHTLFSRVHRFFFSLDSSLYNALWLLLIRPGQLTLDFWNGRHRPYVSPWSLFLLALALLFLLTRQPDLLYYSWPAAQQDFPAGLGFRSHAALLQLDPETYASRFDALAHAFSIAGLVLLVPALAQVFYRQFWLDEPYYLQNVVFAAHFLAVALFLLLISSALAYPLPTAWQPAARLLLTTAGALPYLYRSIRTVYRQDRWQAIRKTLFAYGTLALLVMLVWKPAMSYLAWVVLGQTG